MNWRAALQAPFDTHLFTNILAQAWGEHPAVEEVLIVEPLRLRVTRKADASPCYAPLQYLWHDLQVNRQTPPAWRVQRHIQDCLATWKTEFTATPDHRSYIFPILATNAWCRQREAEGGSPVSEPLVGDLHLVYLIHDGDRRVLLQTPYLPDLGLSADALRTLALANLGRDYGPHPQCHDHGQSVYALTSGLDYGSALLADEGVCDSVQKALETDRLMAAVPCCRAIFFTDANQHGSVQRLLRKVVSVYESEPEPLSLAVFIRHRGTWEPEVGPL